MSTRPLEIPRRAGAGGLLRLGALALPVLLLPIWLQEPAGAVGGVQASSSCARCHSNAAGAEAMRDARGRPIAPFDLWQSTMMANSARDPIWRAVLSAELAATPSRAADIEQKCLRCHAPMADRVGLARHGEDSFLHVLDCDSELGELARDGVSCTICHGIAPDGLGEPSSFSGRFRLDGHRRLFGPHENPFPNPMRNMTGFTPAAGGPIGESRLCGSCHTLETHALDPDGHENGAVLLEQAPYLEWRNSAFRAEGPDPGATPQHCQGCHLPTVDVDGRSIATRIARNPGGRDFPAVVPRSPFGRHLLVGGNTLGLSLLRDHREALGVVAPASAFDATIAATQEQLRTRTARVHVEEVETGESGLRFRVRVENLAGHKLPTAHPTRRVWIGVAVHGADGVLRFVSGATDEQGRIVDGQGEPLPSERAGGPVAPHRDVIRSDTEVALYRAVMADAQGAPTHTLMRGARWLVDDRLLPRGWSSAHPDADRTRPVGVEGDADFLAGSDRVLYALSHIRERDVRIDVVLLHQSLSARWVAELEEWDTPEIRRLLDMLSLSEHRTEALSRAAWPGTGAAPPR